MTDIEASAKAFAEFHHGAVGQVRRYTGEPYINHPMAVAELVRSVPHSPEMLAAAWLHDTVEDTNATLGQILKNFGPEVTDLVNSLTDFSGKADGNRAVRKAIDRAHIAKASPAAKTVKLADLIDNTRTIVALDPGFAAVYMEEKRLLLKVLVEGDGRLFLKAMDLCNAYDARSAA